MKITYLLPLLFWLLPFLPCRAADDESYYGKPVVSASALDIYRDKIQFSDTSAPSGQKLKVISPYNLGVAIESLWSVDWANPGEIGSITPNEGAFSTLSVFTPIAVASGGTGTDTPSLIAGANVTITGTWPNQTVASSAVGMTSSDLAGGTTLAVNTAYFDTVSASRTFAALPAGTNGDQITLTFDVTGTTQALNFHTNSTVYRIGVAGAIGAAIDFSVGNHTLRLTKQDGKWWLTDSGTVVDALVLPSAAGTAALTAAGQVSLNTTDKLLGIHNGTREVAIPLTYSKEFSFDPKAVCDGAVDRLFCFTVGAWAPKGITITRWRASFEADPTTEVDLDLKRADAFIGVANAVVMDAVDTTAGVSTETTAGNINAGAVVAAGKVIYLEFGTAYTESAHQMIVEIEYEIEED